MFSQVLAAIPALEVDHKRRDKSRNGGNQIQYDVKFPPGSMGLELEPVIISSERQLGCRVKDYYFDIDSHMADSRGVVKMSSNSSSAGVGIGDIIWKIEGQQVNAQSFTEILETLKLLADSHRTITFKNISRACKSSTSYPSSRVYPCFLHNPNTHNYRVHHTTQHYTKKGTPMTFTRHQVTVATAQDCNKRPSSSNPLKVRPKVPGRSPGRPKVLSWSSS